MIRRRRSELTRRSSSVRTTATRTRSVWARGDWPRFRFDRSSLTERLAAVRHLQGRLLARMTELGFPLQREFLTSIARRNFQASGSRCWAGPERDPRARWRTSFWIGGATRVRRNPTTVPGLAQDDAVDRATREILGCNVPSALIFKRDASAFAFTAMPKRNRTSYIRSRVRGHPWPGRCSRDCGRLPASRRQRRKPESLTAVSGHRPLRRGVGVPMNSCVANT